MKFLSSIKNLGKTKLGFNFSQINLFNEELRVFQIIVSLVLPKRPLQP